MEILTIEKTANLIIYTGLCNIIIGFIFGFTINNIVLTQIFFSVLLAGNLQVIIGFVISLFE